MRATVALLVALALSGVAQAMPYYAAEDYTPRPSLRPPPPPPPAPPGPAGQRGPLAKGAFFECNHVTPTERDSVLQRLHNAGATYVRTYLMWHFVEPTQGTLNEGYLGQMDACVREATRLGMRLNVFVASAPLWAKASSAPLANPYYWNGPTAPGAYASIVASLAARWPGQVWEVWNEQNLRDPFWDGTVAEYVRLLRETYRAVKAADPTSTVLLGGLSLSDRSWLEDAYQAGAAGFYDAVAVHPYPVGEEAPSKHYADPANDRGLEAILAFRAVMLAHGDTSPVWITEAGWSTTYVPEDVQADYVTEALDYTRDRLPFVPVFEWFQAYDHCCSPWERGMALIRADLTPRPALDAFARWH